MTYYIKHTEKNITKPDIDIQENSINVETDITLFGRKKLEYGQDMNINLLRILENFACPEDPMNVGWPHVNIAGTVSDTNKRVLSTPSTGQLWYNKTANSMYVYDGVRWIRMANIGDVAFNWGTLFDGEYIPVPESSTGQPFTLSDCTWIASLETGVLADSTECFIDSMGMLTANYTVGGTKTSTSASVLVVAIRGNINMGALDIPFGGSSPPSAGADPGDGGSGDGIESPQELQYIEYPSIPDLYALNGYEESEEIADFVIDDLDLLELETFDIPEESVEEQIKRDPIFFEEYNETYGFRYTTIGLVFEEDGTESKIYSVVNKERKFLCSTNKKYVFVSSDGLGRDNVRPVDDSFDLWILLDGEASFTYGIKERKEEDSMDYVNFIVYLSDDDSLDASDQFGQISYRMAKK